MLQKNHDVRGELETNHRGLAEHHYFKVDVEQGQDRWLTQYVKFSHQRLGYKQSMLWLLYSINLEKDKVAAPWKF